MYTKVFRMKEQSLGLSSPPACMPVPLPPPSPSSDAEQLLMC